MVHYFHLEKLIFLRVLIYLWIVLAFCVKILLWYHKDDPPVWKRISHPQRYYILSRNSEFSIQRLNFSMGCTSKGLLLDSNKGWIKCWQLFQHFGWSHLEHVVKTKFKIHDCLYWSDKNVSWWPLCWFCIIIITVSEYLSWWPQDITCLMMTIVLAWF